MIAHNQRQHRIHCRFGNWDNLQVVAQRLQTVVERHNGAADARLHRLYDLERGVAFKDVFRRQPFALKAHFDRFAVVHPFGEKAERQCGQRLPVGDPRSELKVAPIVQQPHPGHREPLHVEKLAIDVVQIADPEVELVTAHAIDNLLRGQRQQAKLQLGILFAQGLNQLHRVEAGQRHHADPQLANHLPAANGRLRLQPVVGGEQRPRPRQNAFPFGSKALEALPALDQHEVQLLFQAANAHRKRRLGDMTGRCGLAKMAGPVEGDQVLELFNIHD